MFISFEGIDTSGKSTIAKLLKEKILKENPYLFKNFIIETREPADNLNKQQQELRNIILNNKTISKKSRAIIFTLLRQQHIETILKPNLDTFKLIICDRYIDSFYSYQGWGDELGYKWVKSISKPIIKNITPDITFYLKISLNELKERRNKRDKQLLNDIDNESDNYFLRVIKGYNFLANKFKKRIKTINTFNLSKQDVVNICYYYLKKHKKFKEFINFFKK